MQKFVDIPATAEIVYPASKCATRADAFRRAQKEHSALVDQIGILIHLDVSKNEARFRFYYDE
jgi:hypothetical protein